MVKIMNIIPRDITHPDVMGLDAFITEHNKQYEVTNPQKYAFAAYDENEKCVGALQGRYRTSSWAELNMLGVSQKGEGIGTRLCQEFEAFLKTQNCKAVCLSTLSNGVEKFYIKNGFTEYARIPSFAGEFDRVFMKKDL